MTDDALSETERAALSALLDTILPASNDGRMPSAAEFDFTAYLAEQAEGFLAALPGILAALGDGFAGRSLAERVTVVEGFARAEPETFRRLLMRVYDCYYQDDRVRGLIGAPAGWPFPRGNTIPAGDLSGLEAVVQRGKGYRR